ncbi:MAG: D-amino acid dehydrogenase [Burkholderiaceae bacterium]|nr:D-amino acid dehydrogenase [Burkholderiaceae bacterium]
MHVIVVGAGIVGVCCAWYLRREGFDVTVLERRSGVAQETSFANAGIVAPGYVTPWASPGMPRKVLSYLFAREAPLRFTPTANPAQWRWLARWFGQCRLERYRANRERMQRVAFYSRTQLHALRDELGIQYEQAQGYLQLLRSPREIELTEPARAMLAQLGVPFSLLDPAQVYELEPGLYSATALAAGLHLPEDESGNCALFAHALRRHAEDAGTRFRFNQTVQRIVTEGGAVRGVVVARREIAADAVVIAAANASPELLRPCGLRIPMYPIKGYSATVALDPAAIGPRRALMDEAYKTAITPFGNRIRIAGTAEIGDYSLGLHEPSLRTLLKVAKDWFPGAARYSGAQYWSGARPMLPDGAPLLGVTPVKGLFLNLGHGSTGWAMACGSGRVVADVVAGRAPEITLDGLTLERYR